MVFHLPGKNEIKMYINSVVHVYILKCLVFSMMAESDDTKCCLIAKFSDRSLLYESPSLKNITLKTLICPYKKEYEALLIFNSCKGKMHRIECLVSKNINEIEAFSSPS